MSDGSSGSPRSEMEEGCDPSFQDFDVDGVSGRPQWVGVPPEMDFGKGVKDSPDSPANMDDCGWLATTGPREVSVSMPARAPSLPLMFPRLRRFPMVPLGIRWDELGRASVCRSCGASRNRLNASFVADAVVRQELPRPPGYGKF